jgi:hypothetical protein
MEIIKSTNGFPYAWKAGRVEHLIRNILENKAREQLNVDRVMFINPTWLHEDDIGKSIREANPDFIICHNFVDPAVPRIFDAIKQSGVPYIILGNSAQYRIDFWAMVCDLYFQNYEERDLEVDATARKYICLNRKPHPHRIAIVNELINAGLQEQGYVSLGLPGEGAITIDETFEDSQGILDEYGNLGVDETFVSRKIRNDIFSVGSLHIWNNSLLCLVSETEFANAYPENFFTSEKTFKPIIGMRPFFIYGQAPLRQYLKDSGFDIFDDVFDYSQIDELTYDPMRQQQYAQTAIRAINGVTNPQEEYRMKYFGRCQANKRHFRTYAYEQWHRLNTLDLTQYV